MCALNRQKSDKNTPFSKAKEKLFDINNELVKFSFKYLDKKHHKFCYDECGTDYFICLIDRLKDVSTMKMTEFRANKSKSLRAHSIDFKETSEPNFNIPGEEQFADEPFQFMVSVNEH